jgi:hypothetical protein
MCWSKCTAHGVGPSHCTATTAPPQPSRTHHNTCVEEGRGMCQTRASTDNGGAGVGAVVVIEEMYAVEAPQTRRQQTGSEERVGGWRVRVRWSPSSPRSNCWTISKERKPMSLSTIAQFIPLSVPIASARGVVFTVAHTGCHRHSGTNRYNCTSPNWCTTFCTHTHSLSLSLSLSLARAFAPRTTSNPSLTRGIVWANRRHTQGSVSRRSWNQGLKFHPHWYCTVGHIT